MDELEKEILSYLNIYGNTRESDLLGFGTRILGQSNHNLQIVLDKMAKEGYVRRIVHDKLGSDAVYVAKGDLPIEIALNADAGALQGKDKRKIIAEAKKILEEAHIVAERRIRERFPELSQVSEDDLDKYLNDIKKEHKLKWKTNRYEKERTLGKQAPKNK